MNLLHLRAADGSNDQPILDTQQLIELGRVPGWVGTTELAQLWGVTENQASRRLRAVNRLGVICTTPGQGRTFLRRADGVIHLRVPGGASDQVILDTMQLIELGRVPGWVGTTELAQLWGVSQCQVSRRLKAIKELGVICADPEWGRAFLYRSDDPKEVKAWLEAVNERRQAQLSRKRKDQARRMSKRNEQRARWERLRVQAREPPAAARSGHNSPAL